MKGIEDYVIWVNETLKFIEQVLAQDVIRFHKDDSLPKNVGFLFLIIGDTWVCKVISYHHFFIFYYLIYKSNKN